MADNDGDVVSRIRNAPPPGPAKVKIHRRERGGADKGNATNASDNTITFEHFTNTHPEVLAGKRLPDDRMVRLIKEAVNAAGINRNSIYRFVNKDTDINGTTILFQNNNQAYNLEYGLRTRSSMTLESADKWMAIIGQKLNMFISDAE